MVFSSCLQKFGSGRHYFGWIDKDGSVKMRAGPKVSCFSFNPKRFANNLAMAGKLNIWTVSKAASGQKTVELSPQL
jgi:hypothetical protein